MKYLGLPQSGSQANTVASRNRYGQYFRTRAIPVQPRTSKQVANRGTFGSLAKAWTTALTDAQRASWNAWATTHPKVNSLGATITLTGLQAYLSINQFLLRLGIASVVAPPSGADFSVAFVTNATAVASTSVVSVSHGTITGLFNWVAFAGPPRPAGVTYEGNYRLIGPGAGAGAAGTTILTTAYAAVWGSLTGKAGQRIHWKFYDDDTSGNKGPLYSLTTTIS